jgi:hypothetical protein
MPEPIYVQSSANENTRVIPMADHSTASLISVDFIQHKINAGDHFIAHSYDTDVDTAGPKYWKIITPDTTKWAHMIFAYSCSAAGLWEIYENPTYGTTPAAGTAVTAYNSNRNSNTASGLTLKVDPTLGSGGAADAGTLIWAEYMAAAGSSEKCKLILKQNEDYIIRFTPDADNTKADLMLTWFEHTNES